MHSKPFRGESITYKSRAIAVPMILALLLTLLFASGLIGAGVRQNLQDAEHVQVSTSSVISISLRGEFSDLKSEVVNINSQSFSQMVLEGEATTYIPNQPVLPSVSRFVVVPPTSNLELVISFSEPVRVPADLPPLIFTPDSGLTISSFEQGDIFPSVVAEMSPPIIIRGVRLVKVTIYPVRYDYRTNEFMRYKSIDTEVRAVDGEPINPVLNPLPQNVSREFSKFMENFAINGDIAHRDDPDRDQEPQNSGKYLIVTHEGCLEYIIPFIEFRRKVGYQVDILSLPEDEAADTVLIKDQIQEIWDADREAGIDPFQYLFLIGDYNYYDNFRDPDPGFILESPMGTPEWPRPPHSDIDYACLEGDDRCPDVAFGRWPAGSEATLGLMVGRQLAVSANPETDRPEIFSRAAACSHYWGRDDRNYWRPVINSVVRWGEEVLKRSFSDVRFLESMVWDRVGGRVGPFLRTQLNSPVNIFIGRAQWYFYSLRGRHDFEEDIQINTFFPTMISLSDRDEYGMCGMVRVGDADNLRGLVAMTNGWGYGNLQFRNVIWMELVHSILRLELPMGWGMNYSLNMFPRFFPEDLMWHDHDALQLHLTDNNLIGDPAFSPWMVVPRVVSMEHPESLSPDSRLIEVFVHNEDNDSPIEDAIVTLYAPGEIPLGEAEAYANYDDIMMKVAKTNADGLARFILSEGENFIIGTTVFITASGRDIKPCFGQSDVVDPEDAIELGEWTLEEQDGNGDGAINPDEIFHLGISARNADGENVIANVTAAISSSSPFLTIEDNNQVIFGDIPAGQQVNGNRNIRLEFSPLCPDGTARPVTRPIIDVEFTSGERVWRSALYLEPQASHLEFVEVVGGSEISDSISSVDVIITNIGSISSPQISANLQSLTTGVIVSNGTSSYNEIASGNTDRLAGTPFSIVCDQLMVPGSKAEMMLLFETEAGILDTTFFQLQIAHPREDAPFGPDNYGYFCFDNTDTSWFVAPTFDWIEINPDSENPRYNGTRLDIDGRSENYLGDAVVVPLGFETQFYGSFFDSITVAWNGFISVGSQPRIGNYSRFPMDEAMGGGVGMIAPFWDEFDREESSGVYLFIDQDSGRAIVEWDSMVFISENRSVNFQAILYNREIWNTETGDQNILFQYLSIANPANTRPNDRNIWIEPEWLGAFPFASVGVSSPDGLSGVSYSWIDTYPDGAAPLEDGRAVLFTTSTGYHPGLLWGRVHDEATALGMEGVSVFTDTGISTLTDEEGNWQLNGVQIERPFSITARTRGYNDSTYTNLVIEENDSLEINFGLLHPDFEISTDGIEAELRPDESEEVQLLISNSGNGCLEWSVELRLTEEVDIEPWEHLTSNNVGELVEDPDIQGVAFLQDHFYIAGGGNDPSQIYVLNSNHDFVSSFDQPGETVLGFYDLACDGELLWGGDNSNQVYGFNTDGEAMHHWQGPEDNSKAIAYDTERETLWITGATSERITSYSVDGEELNNITQFGLNLYGLAFWRNDPDGYQLYAIHNNFQGSYLYKIDIVNQDTLFVRRLDTPDGGMPIGINIASPYDTYSGIFLAISNNEDGDRLDVWQFFNITSWMAIEPTEGTINPDQAQELVFTLNTTDLIMAETYAGRLLLTHNAEDGGMEIPITLRVESQDIEEHENAILPLEFGLHPSYPNPFNSTTTIAYSLPIKASVKLQLFDLDGRMIRTLEEGNIKAGEHRSILNASKLPSGLYLLRMETAKYSATQKVILIR